MQGTLGRRHVFSMHCGQHNENQLQSNAMDYDRRPLEACIGMVCSFTCVSVNRLQMHKKLNIKFQFKLPKKCLNTVPLWHRVRKCDGAV